MRATIEKQKTLELISAESLMPETYRRTREEVAREIGALSLQGVCEIEFVENDEQTTLDQAIRAAKSGSKQSIDIIRSNVRTDVAERLYKAGHVTQMGLGLSGDRLVQHGTSLVDVHRNTLKHMSLNPVMKERTELEYGNAVILGRLAKAGTLDDYDAVVFSMTPQDEATKKQYNFFTNTDSVSVQYVQKQGSQINFETAMVAGKTHANGLRHDIGVIGTMLEQAGIESQAMSENESLKHILLVPKGESNGVHDVVRHFDTLAGGTFYGQNVQAVDYEEHRELCKEREASFEDIVDSVVDGLLEQSSKIHSPIDAVKLLDSLSDKYCVQGAVDRKDIDLAVFGREAAGYISVAREHLLQGNVHSAQVVLSSAHQVSTSGSCPSSFSKMSSLFEGGDSMTDGLTGLASSDEDKFGPLSFRCKYGHLNRRPRGKLISQCRIKSCKNSVAC